MDSRYRVGFDIGGTFTDFALHDAQSGSLHIHKTLTTPDDPSRGAVEGIAALLGDAGHCLAEIGRIVHGTTLVTNALIERKGAATGLLATRGFRDVLELGFEQRYDVYNLFLRYPEPLVPRQWRREIDERIGSEGEVLTPLRLDPVRREAEELLRNGVQSVAVCFLHSYRNAAHEMAVGDLLAREFPELRVSLSCEVAAEVREYERTCTTAANAFVQPLMDRYLERLEGKLTAGGFAGQLSLILSSGDLSTLDTARRFPIRLLESGPAGGALATGLIGRSARRPELIGFDMGGTTAKAALIRDGRPTVAPAMEVARVDRFKRGSGIPVRSPVVEMIEIGAGGGSIARLDEVGLIRVGPDSAGAQPGPACYGLGGSAPTVTDANLVLGYLDPAFFLGGRMALNRAASGQALAELGRPLGLDAAASAWGVYSIVCESMAAAARGHAIERGRDPRDFSMVALGGAGPAHAAQVARVIGIREVLVPPASGAASAVGFLSAPAAFEAVRSAVIVIEQGLDIAALDLLLSRIESEAAGHLGSDASGAGSRTVSRSAEMRLRGQVHEILVPIPGGALGAEAVDEIRANFIRTYETMFRGVPPDATIEGLSWRVRVSLPAPEVNLRPTVTPPGAAALKGTRPAYFGNGFVQTPVYDRYGLRAGDHVAGPAIIEERESTTVVPPGDHVEVDDNLNLKLTIGEARRAQAPAGQELTLDEAVLQIEGDPIGLEIMWARLVNIADECWDAVCRTAFSLIISDAQDFSLALFDTSGGILAQSPRAQPVFNLSLPRAIEALLESFPPADLSPGDVLVTNDPWLTSGHLFDVAFVTPVFHDGQLVGHIGAIGHVTDIGGTRDPEVATEIYEEGFQIPPMKLYRAGRLNEDLVALLRANVRDQQQVMGDIHAMVGASSVGAQRLGAFLAEYGLKDLAALRTIFQGRSEAAMRDAIGAVPNGVYESEIRGLIGDAVQSLPVRITVGDDSIDIDFTGAPPQSPRGGFNCTLNYASAHAVYPFKCLLTPGVRSNAGCFRPFTLHVPDGSILNCRRPASVSRRQSTGWYLGPNTFSALAGAIPYKVKAFTGLPISAPCFGLTAAGTPFIDYLFGGGGEGGSATGDGKSGLLYPIGSANTSTELFEIRTRLLIAEKQLSRDTGGAGRHRGGLGQTIRIVKLLEDGNPAFCAISQFGKHLGVRSMLGGKPGAPARLHPIGIKADGNEDLRIGKLWKMHRSGAGLEIHSAGGHGYGDPLDRDLHLIAHDLRNDYISKDEAEAEYGCVFDASGGLDPKLTEENRARQRADSSRGPGGEEVLPARQAGTTQFDPVRG